MKTKTILLLTYVVAAISEAEFTCADAPAGTFYCDDFESSAPLADRYFESSNTNFQPTDSVGRDGSRGLKAVFDAGTVNAGSIKKSFGRTPSSYIGKPRQTPRQPRQPRATPRTDAQ